MATRSAIAVMHGTVIKAVYCHWDGYLENNGVILNDHYNSIGANMLVALGDISSLKPTIGEAHAFSHREAEMPLEEYEALYGNMTTFYARDRGEEGVEFATFMDFESFYDDFDKAGCEYYYVMKEGEWYYSKGYGDELQLLAPKIAEIKQKEMVA